MNIALEQTEEHINGAVIIDIGTRSFVGIMIRYNHNVVLRHFIPLLPGFDFYTLLNEGSIGGSV
ncbi:uncharacterized protein BJ212DRAFT_900570 [Suillus subaureus]|uniref:Uncharacterized protein n=1 Tax=Suillus subaureus TaxID=48587 RepID=A0A9P7AL50_9AGAM|nr:uncharacterized protein BJ212DRAFT_900570 [Suillus subaureus]KAG1791495.1 hypothetical protein BJ212DRAFT_900570 [Suillus subaureus]